MKIAVTGAGGHIGANLIRELLHDNHEVRVLYRSDRRPFHNLDVEKIRGDILDTVSIENFCSGFDVVIHLAARISIGKQSYKKLYDINLTGTQNVLKAARKKGVKKFIHFSSIHALKVSENSKVLDENCQLAVDSKNFYEKTKALAEQYVLKQKSDAFEVIVLNPTGVIGPYDFKPSYMGKFLIDVYKNKINPIVPGGYDWVDVRDVAASALAAIKKGRNGERYILSGRYASLFELSRIIGQIKTQKINTIVLPFWLAKAALPFIQLTAKITHKEPLFTKDSLSVLQTGNTVFSHEKALKELGHNPRALEETLKSALKWFKENAYL